MALVEWATLTRGEVTQAFAGDALAAIAIGALEQHGDHLPTDTDAFLAQTILEEAANRSEAVVVSVPPMPFGYSPYHMRFGGTVSLTAETFLCVLRDICRSVRSAGAGRLLIVNGHGGNEGALRMMAHECTGPEFSVYPVSYWDAAPPWAREAFAEDDGHFGHAGQLETSLLMAMRPSAVREVLPAFEPILPAIRPPTAEQLGASGVIGNPGAAAPELGASFHQAAVGGLAAYIDALARQRVAIS